MKRNIMIIKELFSKTYQIIKFNLILVQPLLIFSLLLGFILAPLSMGMLVNNAAVIMILAVAGLFCAFLSGWFSMFHKSIELSDKQNLTKEERAINSLNLLKEFFPGVGKYFPKIVFGIIIYIILFLLVMNLAGIIGDKFIGYPGNITPDEFSKALMNQDSYSTLFNKLSESDKKLILKWDILTIALTATFSYLTMFWAQAVISEDKNPLQAYLESLKTVVKRPFVSLIIFISCWGSIAIVSIISSVFYTNVIVQFIGLMLLILIVVYYTIMTFIYFEKYRKNNSISRADCIR